MKNAVAFALGIFVLCATAVRAQPAPPPMAGAYQCVNRETGGVVWRFASNNTIDGPWLVVHTTFAPQNGQGAQKGVTYVGYDSDAKRWNIVAIQSTGSYYTRSSTSTDINGSRWTDGYPSDGGRAVLRIPSTQKYTFDLVTPQDKGPAVESHVVCTHT